MNKEFKLTDSDDLNHAIEEFVTAMKAVFAEGNDQPSVWVIMYIRRQYEWLQIPSSHRAFEESINNRAHVIRQLVKLVMKHVKDTDGPATLKAVVAVSDAYFTVREAPKESVSVEDHIKAVVDAPDYIPPRDDPNHIEAFLVTFCFKDSNKCFMYEYDRKGDMIFFKEQNRIDPGFAMGGGGFTKLYPQDL